MTPIPAPLSATIRWDDAERRARVSELLALDTPDVLKRTQMHGQVLEINTDQPEEVLLVLKNAKQAGTLPLDEVALYGAQVHAVVSDAERATATVLTARTNQLSNGSDSTS